MRNEAFRQVDKDWIGPPSPIEINGDLATVEAGQVNMAFRFGVRELGNLRACDDLRRNTDNLHYNTVTPIKLPTWGHVAQMCLDIADEARHGGFAKSDHEAEYKRYL